MSPIYWIWVHWSLINISFPNTHSPFQRLGLLLCFGLMVQVSLANGKVTRTLEILSDWVPLRQGSWTPWWHLANFTFWSRAQLLLAVRVQALCSLGLEPTPQQTDLQSLKQMDESPPLRAIENGVLPLRLTGKICCEISGEHFSTRKAFFPKRVLKFMRWAWQRRNPRAFEVLTWYFFPKPWAPKGFLVPIGSA